MIQLIIILTVKDEADTAEVRELLRKQGRLSRAEPGCLRFEVCQSRETPGVFLLNERWESQEALDAHRLAEAYTQVYRPLVIPLVERTAHPATLLD